MRKNRLNIDPNSLLPKLPSPSELKPFPTVVQTIFRGHEGRVRSVAIDPVSDAFWELAAWFPLGTCIVEFRDSAMLTVQ